MPLLADRVPQGQKTMQFKDQHGTLTVTGSDAYGLPTATDADVIVALIYLTKLRNDFQDIKVGFSKYEIINLLNWSDDSYYYKRLEQSFHRWSGVLLVYDKCRWNNKTKRYVGANMHIIDSVVFAEPGSHARGGQSPLPLSTFTWNKTFIESCQAENPGGYLAESIRKSYAPPKGFESKTAREKKQTDERERKRRAEEAQRRAEAQETAREEAEQLRVSAYLASLTAEEREALQAKAIAKANPFFARPYRRSQGDAKSEARYLELIVGAHVSEILADRESARV